VIYLSGMLLMAWNVVMTARAGRVTPAAIPALAAAPAAAAA
jgi:cytochrome c oxidase cbb3-type subunit 1